MADWRRSSLDPSVADFRTEGKLRIFNSEHLRVSRKPPAGNVPCAFQVKEECGKIPATQLAAFEKVKAGIPSNSFHSALDELCRITRRGDKDMLKKVATLDLSFPKIDKAFLAGFVRDVQDPAALDLLIELDQRGGHFSFLQTIGSLGNPKAFDHFECKKKIAVINPVTPSQSDSGR